MRSINKEGIDMEHGYNTILLVHMENANFVSRFTTLFEEKGFTLYHVPNIEGAYQVLGSQSVEIIVLDMDENYAEAFKFCHSIKRNKNLEKILIIGLSAAHTRFGIYIDAQTKEERRWLNCDLFIHKPINAKNLYLLLKKEIAIMQGIDATKLDSPDEAWL